jgi:hypothetical protein
MLFQEIISRKQLDNPDLCDILTILLSQLERWVCQT